ncbi:glycosyltransferase family 9 protein [Microbacterium sp. BK668]|uniref:glycosyltransferase family 9 protein n=1 Tax=Microbacterium sp. BK668 TaxID=2512118 RepID=UPI00105FF742|nr:glycosyltransferase family 9 protein [Microbacterium sp. BK668]TDN90688.1 ADP-heptose:LPS heptosyltransferase [Microbacterium sp. BK668]
MTRRVLVARLDSTGDVLLCGPAVRAVAAGADEVWMLCSSRGAEAAGLLPGVDRVLEWDCPWITANPPAATPERLADLQALVTPGLFDSAVILTSFHQSPLPLALQLRLAGVPFMVGASVDYAGTLLDVRLRPGEDFPEELPEPLRALTIARAAGFDLPEGDAGRLQVVPGEPPANLGAGSPVVVHPGADAPSRRWPAEHFADAVRLLHAEGLDVVVTGGRGEMELTRLVSGDGAFARDLGGSTDLAAMAGLLERARVLVCGNTGPAHLAAAVGTPVVSLFSPVVPAVQWAPYGVPVILLGDQDAVCRGTRARECPVPGHPCLSSVTPGQVAEAVQALARTDVREEAPV